MRVMSTVTVHNDLVLRELHCVVQSIYSLLVCSRQRLHPE